MTRPGASWRKPRRSLQLSAENYGSIFCRPIRRIATPARWSGSIISKPPAVGRSRTEEDFAKKARRSMRDLLRAEKPISISEAYSDTPDVVE